MVKVSMPVTLDDLQATAKDDKHGWTMYKYLKVKWDCATGGFTYSYKSFDVNAGIAEEYLKECQL